MSPGLRGANEIGQCPLCEANGTIGAPCSQTICEKKGYHFIPEPSLAQLRGPRRGLDPLIGRRIDGWLATGVLGAGAFGVVFLVENDQGQQGALKLISRREDDADKASSVLKKFRLEAEALAALDHPNIVGLLHAGEWEDGPYLVMEYVAGGKTLKRMIEQAKAEGRTVERDVAWHVLRQVLSALGTAHAPPRRIVHRDIKPENIMVRADDGDPYHIKVLDFGLAKFVEDGTETTQAMGTPAYMAPEQLWKQRIGPWTDLYAVGVMTFELLTGRRPFSGTTDEIVQRKASPGFDVLTEAQPGEFDPQTDAFLRRALAFSPEARFGDADEMAAALDVLPPFVGLAAAYGEEVEMDPEKLRLKRMEEQMQAERRRLDDERRRLEQDRAQLDSQRVAGSSTPTLGQTGAPTGSPGLPTGTPLPSGPQPLPTPEQQGGSRGGMFLGLAGGVLLIGVLLIVGKAYLSGKAEEQVAPAPQPAAAVAPAPVAPAPPAPEAVAPDVAAVPAPDVVIASADSAPEPDGAVASADAAAEDVAVAAAADAEAADAAVAAADVAPPPPGGEVSIGSSKGEPAKAEVKADAPKKAPPKKVIEKPVVKKVDPAAKLGQAFREAEEKKRKEREAEAARKKAFQEGLGKEFKKSQTK
ncbi:MAG: protein kinase [Deltaproteobacteria bacterium]|nr:protein kinase [Deltaproteobacteria bacterium]